MEDADASGQELEEESPTQHKFVSLEKKLMSCQGSRNKLTTPDGEELKYIGRLKTNEFQK